MDLLLTNVLYFIDKRRCRSWIDVGRACRQPRARHERQTTLSFFDQRLGALSFKKSSQINDNRVRGRFPVSSPPRARGLAAGELPARTRASGAARRAVACDEAHRAHEPVAVAQRVAAPVRRDGFQLRHGPLPAATRLGAASHLELLQGSTQGSTGNGILRADPGWVEMKCRD